MPAISASATATGHHHVLTRTRLRPHVTVVFLLVVSWSQPAAAIFTRTSDELTQAAPEAERDLVLRVC